MGNYSLCLETNEHSIEDSDKANKHTPEHSSK